MSSRILVIAYEFFPFPGGQATYAFEMARSMAARGDEILVCAPRYVDQGDEASDLEVLRLLNHQHLGLLDFPRIGALIAARRPTAILVADVRAAVVAVPWARLLGIPIVAMFHGSELHKIKGRGPAARIALAILRRATRFVANSEFSAALATKVLKRPCGAAPLGVEDYWLQDPGGEFSNDLLRAIPPDEAIVCTVGRLEPRKGHLDGLAVVRQARAAGARFRYVIAGKVVDEQYAREVLSGLGPDDAYVGQLSRNDIRRLYRRSVCLLSPARKVEGRVEGFGLATLEAAAQGAPSIVTDTGGLPEAVVDGVTGFVVPEGDVERLAVMLAGLVRDPGKCSELRVNAIAHARAATWARTLRRTPLLGDLDV